MNLKVEIKTGNVLYGVEDNNLDNPYVIQATVEDVFLKQIRFVDGEKLFNQSRVSKHDPRVSLYKEKAITAYIIRKQRQINDLNKKGKLRKCQLRDAKQLLKNLI